MICNMFGWVTHLTRTMMPVPIQFRFRLYALGTLNRCPTLCGIPCCRGAGKIVGGLLCVANPGL
jgi:hypothetical protein